MNRKERPSLRHQQRQQTNGAKYQLGSGNGLKDAQVKRPMTR